MVNEALLSHPKQQDLSHRRSLAAIDQIGGDLPHSSSHRCRSARSAPVANTSGLNKSPHRFHDSFAQLAGLTILASAILLSDHLQPAIVPPLRIKTTVKASMALAGASGAASGAGGISASMRDLLEVSGRSRTL